MNDVAISYLKRKIVVTLIDNKVFPTSNKPQCSANFKVKSMYCEHGVLLLANILSLGTCRSLPTNTTQCCQTGIEKANPFKLINSQISYQFQ